MCERCVVKDGCKACFCFQHPGGPRCAAAHRIWTPGDAAVAGVENGPLWECSEVTIPHGYLHLGSSHTLPSSLFSQ